MATTKKKYNTVEENLARRKYYNGTRPVATGTEKPGGTINYIDGKPSIIYNRSVESPSYISVGSKNSTAGNSATGMPEVPTLDLTNKPTYTPQDAFKAPEAYQSQAFNAPEAYQAPNVADYMKGNYNVGDFNSQWGDKLNSLYNEIAGRGKFSYDQSKDPLYQQYAEMYRKNAQLAMSDTVAKAASLTGGYGNSYAETAGQSMYNQTMDNLNERALDLYDRALNAWALEGENLNQRFNMAGQMYNNDYNAWRAKMQDAQYQQQFDYNRYLNDRDFGYNQWADNYNRARSEWEYNDQMGYQRSRDARNDAWNEYTYAGDEAKYAYETANQDYWNTANYNLDIYDRNNDNYWRNIENEWRAKEFDNDNYWKQQEFDWNKETYNRDDAFRYDQLGYQDKWNQQDLDYNYARLGEDSRQFDLTRGDNNYWNRQDDIYRNKQLGYQDKWNQQNYNLDAFNAGYDPVTGGMSAEARARQDAEDRFNYWQAGYDPETGGMTPLAAKQYQDSLALDYAKLGMNPDGSLNAIGQMERDQIDAKAGSGAAKALAGYTANSNQIINQGIIPTREQFESAKTYYGPNQYGVMGDKGGQVEGKYYKKYDDYVDALLDSMSGATEEERQYILWYYTGKEKK